MNLEIIYIHVHVSGIAVLFKVKFVDQGQSCYAARPDRKNALGLYLYHMLTPFLLRIYVKVEWGRVIKHTTFVWQHVIRLV